eukprot:13457870-Alexandrium_andersonii.AAC.1
MYTRHCKPLAAVCCGLQRFAARPPGGLPPPWTPPQKCLQRAPAALFGGSERAVARPDRCKLLQAMCSAWYTFVGMR